MDVVLVGLPGSGKSVVGRRLASRHGATFLDLDESIERATGRTIPEIFESDGEAAFRALERSAVADLGPADPSPTLKRVISTGGGTVIDPRNRWQLFRGRVPIWLDARPEVLAQRLRRSVRVRPLVTGRDPIGAVRELGRARERYYAAAHHLNSVAEVASVVDAADRLVGVGPLGGTVLLRASTRLGDLVLGEGIAAAAVAAALRRHEARRAIIVSEPGAWAAVGERLADDLHHDDWTIGTVLLPQGEDAKRLSVVETAARELARMRVERGEPIVAVGGGALGDTAGFLAATYLRGRALDPASPRRSWRRSTRRSAARPAVDLPEGKNLVGAFHQPATIVIDVATLRSLPPRQLRAALGECAKMAALGDERLFATLEAEGRALAAGDASAWASGRGRPRSSSAAPGRRSRRSSPTSARPAGWPAAGSR